MYALDRSSGKPAWQYDTAEDGPRAEFHGEALLVGDTLVMPSDAEPSASLYAFDAATGEVRWRKELPGGVATTPLLMGGGKSVIAAGATGTLVRVELVSGKTAWTAAPAGERPKIPFLQSPAADAKRVYFASNDGRLFALDAANGAVVWKKELAARINTSLVLYGGSLYAGSVDGALYALDPASGEIHERVAVGGVPYGTLVAAPPLLIVLVNGKPSRLVALDLSTHRVRWERSADREWTTMKPLVRDGAVIAGTEAKELCAFALADGKERWCTKVPQVPRGLGAAGGMLYLGTLNGKVLAYRLE